MEGVFVRIKNGDRGWKTRKNNVEIVLFLTAILIVCWLRTAKPDNDEVEKETEFGKIAIPTIVL